MARSPIPRNTFVLVRIEKDLLRLVGSPLSVSEAERLARDIDSLPRDVVARVLAWTEIFARLHAELGAGFVRAVVAIAKATHMEGYEAWARRAAEAFDHRGLGAALSVVNDPDGFVAEYRARARGCDFDSCRRRLGMWLAGLGAPSLRLAKGPRAVTDTERLWLPSAFQSLPKPEDNYRLYQALAVFLWSQVRYQTWSRARVMDLLRQQDLDLAVNRFLALETARLFQALTHDFPAVARAIHHLAIEVDGHDEWLTAPERFGLREPPPDAERSLVVACSLTGAMVLPQTPCFRGAADLALLRERLFSVEAARRQRISVSGEHPSEDQGAASAAGRRAPRPGAAAGTQSGDANSTSRRPSRLEVELHGANRRPAPARPGVGLEAHTDPSTPDRVPTSTTGGQRYDPSARAGSGVSTAGYDRVGADEEVEFVPEWDHERQCYRDDYCTVRILPGAEGDSLFVRDTLERHRGTVKSIKRRFEALIGAPTVDRHQEDGEEVDVDAMVEAHADRMAGLGFPEHLYRRRVDHARSIAALFLVDMSGSTRGWVNQAEREALILLCESFSLLGDTYAIYGFSGRTHKRCEVFRIKAFADRYDDAVKRRIAGIAPKGYTRLGAPIRCLSRRLAAVPARHRLLVTISDGKPEDYRSYSGTYGIEDTRQALTESRRNGIHAFCITIDEDGGDYLPRMYGPANFVVLDDVMQLPYKLAEVYRRLTS